MFFNNDSDTSCFRDISLAPEIRTPVGITTASWTGLTPSRDTVDMLGTVFDHWRRPRWALLAGGADCCAWMESRRKLLCWTALPPVPSLTPRQAAQ